MNLYRFLSQQNNTKYSNFIRFTINDSRSTGSQSRKKISIVDKARNRFHIRVTNMKNQPEKFASSKTVLLPEFRGQFIEGWTI